MTTTKHTEAPTTDVYGRPSIVLIRTCDVCGDSSGDVQWVQTPGLVTEYGADGWQCLCAAHRA